MGQNDQLNKYSKRPFQYWLEDGLTELVVGLGFALVGLFSVLQGLATTPKMIKWAASGVLITMVATPWVGRFIIKRLKEKYVYPRSGYVGYRQPPKSQRRISFVVTLIIVAIIVIAILSTQDISFTWLPLLEGLCVGILLLHQGFRLGVLRMQVFGGISILLGFGISLAGIRGIAGAGLFFLFMGLILGISGFIIFRRYLTKHGSSESSSGTPS